MTIASPDSQNPDLIAVNLPELSKKARAEADRIKGALFDAIKEKMQENDPSKSARISEYEPEEATPRRRAHALTSGSISASLSGEKTVSRYAAPEEETAGKTSLKAMENAAKANDISTISAKGLGTGVTVDSCFEAIRHQQDVVDSCQYLIRKIGNTMFLPKASFAGMTESRMVEKLGDIAISETDHHLSHGNARFMSRDAAVHNSGSMREFDLNAPRLAVPQPMGWKSPSGVGFDPVPREIAVTDSETDPGNPNPRKRGGVQGMSPGYTPFSSGPRYI